MSHSERMSFETNALLTPHETLQMDAHMSSSLGLLMENAGAMVARLIRQHFKPCRVLVACGPGNNGGDGYVVARYLQGWGWPVSVAFWKKPQHGSLAARAAQEWTGPIVAFEAAEAMRAELVVDAVFGAGLSRPLPEDVVHFFQHVPRCVAIDVPSGVDGVSGACWGEVPQAILTVALVRKRPGHLLEPAVGKCGQVVCVDIGMPEEAFSGLKARYWENTPSLWPLPLQYEQDHKYTRGVVSLYGGAHMPGAARFASDSARHTGAGLVCVSSSEEGAALYRTVLPGCVVDQKTPHDSVKDQRRRVWVCGPGLTFKEVESVLPTLLEAQCHVIADAGALAWADGLPEKLRGVKVMTPHLGEFVRVFGPVRTSRLEAAQQASRETGSVIVLKGADTVIAAPDGRTAINRHATPALATAGSGDVLSGIIAALCASGMPAWEASCAAVWIHGEAGRQAAQAKGGWIVAEDLITFLGKARHAAEKSQKLSINR